MLKKASIILMLLFSYTVSKAQLMESFVHTGELGVGVGLAHYFGDLNPDARINSPKMSFGAFYRKQVSNYVGIRISGDYHFLGYSDIYSQNTVQRRRNLSFNTSIWELGLSGDFNFFRFQPGFQGYHYTPYIGLGIAVFSYDPYAYLNGQKYQLRALGTEGQGSALYPNLNPYTSTAIAIPITLGYKYALNERMNIFGELVYRFTNTDYIDDVSGLYAPDAFPPLPDGTVSPAFLLQDRSYETGSSVGSKGRQRGNSLKKDSYASIKIGISFNFQNYRCPTN